MQLYYCKCKNTLETQLTFLTSATEIAHKSRWTGAVRLVIVDYALRWCLARVALSARADTQTVDTGSVQGAV